MNEIQKKEYMKKWRQDNKEKVKASQKKYWENHKEELSKKGTERSRLWRKNNVEKSKATASRRYQENKEEYDKRSRLWYQQHPEAKRLYSIRKKYGLSEDIRIGAICCDVCGSKEWGHRGPNIDHDHVTDRVRGIICRDCNLMLGNAKDSTVILQQGIDYLNKHS